MNKEKIKFYLARLGAMDTGELFYRIKWKAKLETYYRYLSKIKETNGKKLDFVKLRDNFHAPRFNFEKEEQKIIQQQYKERFDKEILMKKAGAYLEHKIPIYEINKSLGKDICWNKDYKNDKVWPEEFIGKIHHASIENGEIRYIWELNRFNHSVELAKGYYLTGKEKYAQEVVSEIESWIKQNPYLMTVNWFSGLELGVRLINWIFALKFIKNSKCLNADRLDLIIESIYLQTEFIYNNLSKYSSANNHLIGELAAVKIVSSVFPNLPKAKIWKKRSQRMLDPEMLKQIWIDGVGKEQSLNYLLFDLELYFLSTLNLGEEMNPKVKPRIESCGEFLISISDRNGFPQIGDSDDANLIGFYSNKERIDCVLGTIYGLDIGKNEKLFWLKTSIESNIMKDMPEPESKLFSKGGYFVSRNNEARLIFDCGPLGYLSTAGHGHSDTLSFILSINDREIFTDPGTYVYHGFEEWRNYFRSTEAHNTIKIDNQNQSEIKGTFIYGRKAKSRIIFSRIRNDLDEIVASHNGYQKLGIVHQRKIIHDKIKKEITILDLIKNRDKKSHGVSIYFNLSPRVKVQRIKNKFNLVIGKDKIGLRLDHKLDVKEYLGSQNSILGWNSPKFGVKVPSICLEGRKNIKETLMLETKIKY